MAGACSPSGGQNGRDHLRGQRLHQDFHRSIRSREPRQRVKNRAAVIPPRNFNSKRGFRVISKAALPRVVKTSLSSTSSASSETFSLHTAKADVRSEHRGLCC